MARSDLIIDLVRAGTSGDRRAARSVAEAIVAEERAKQHSVLAEKIDSAIEKNGNVLQRGGFVVEGAGRGRDFVTEIQPRRRLDDLVLAENCRKPVLEMVEEQHRADLLRAYGLEPRHRVLLVGPPGTGKTSLAEAIAEAIGVSLFVVRYEAIIGSFLGETAGRLRRVFDYARTTPSVLFFDEFDAIGKERGDTHETGEIKRVVSSLLMQIDDLPSYTVVVAATNHPELLDRAAWRRFQLRLEMPMPEPKQMAAYLDTFFSRYDQSLGKSAFTIASRLGPVSFADIEGFCLDIARRYILSSGEITLKSIVDDQLHIRNQQAKAATNLE